MRNRIHPAIENYRKHGLPQLPKINFAHPDWRQVIGVDITEVNIALTLIRWLDKLGALLFLFNTVIIANDHYPSARFLSSLIFVSFTRGRLDNVVNIRLNRLISVFKQVEVKTQHNDLPYPLVKNLLGTLVPLVADQNCLTHWLDRQNPQQSIQLAKQANVFEKLNRGLHQANELPTDFFQQTQARSARATAKLFFQQTLAALYGTGSDFRKTIVFYAPSDNNNAVAIVEVSISGFEFIAKQLHNVRQYHRQLTGTVSQILFFVLSSLKQKSIALLTHNRPYQQLQKMIRQLPINLVNYSTKKIAALKNSLTELTNLLTMTSNMEQNKQTSVSEGSKKRPVKPLIFARKKLPTTRPILRLKRMLAPIKKEAYFLKTLSPQLELLSPITEFDRFIERNQIGLRQSWLKQDDFALAIFKKQIRDFTTAIRYFANNNQCLVLQLFIRDEHIEDKYANFMRQYFASFNQHRLFHKSTLLKKISNQEITQFDDLINYANEPHNKNSRTRKLLGI